jgi:hypothetical protein
MSLKMKMQLLQVFNRWRKVAVKAEYSGGRRCLFSGHGIALQLIWGARKVMMRDYPSCQTWPKASVVRAIVPGVRFEFSSNDTSPKPASVVSARSSTVLGQFSLWNTGESDFDIYKDGEVVSHEMGNEARRSFAANCI